MMMDFNDQITELPVGWTVATLSQCCEKVQDGSHFSPQTQHTEAGEDRYLYITAKNIKEYGIDLSDVTWVDHDFHDSIYSRCNPEKGDVLLIKDGVKTGIATVNQLEKPFSLLSSVALLKTKKNFLNPYFLKHYLNSPTGFKATTGAMTGTAIRRIILAKLKTSSIPIPPLPEQQRIVSKIEELFTKLDTGVEELKKAKARLRRYRHSVLKAAVTGELTRWWRETNMNLIDDGDGILAKVLEHRKAAWLGNSFPKKKSGILGRASKVGYKEPVLPITKGMRDLPKNWVYASIDQLISEPMCNGLSIKGQEQPPGVPALKLNAMTSNGIDFEQIRYLPIDLKSVRSIVIRENDFFISRGNGSIALVARGTVAKKPPFDAIFPDTMIRLRFIELIGETMWVQTVWNSLLIRSQIERRIKTTAGIWKISQEQLKNIAVPFPSLEEQRIIVSTVQSIFSTIDKLDSVIEQELSRSVRLRHSIRNHAFSGRLVPQDTADEPAQKLLNRIRESVSKTTQSKRKGKSNGDTPNGK